ncbi:MAG: hypothetical protein HDQ91_02170 [Desulfovibrio sp.]|nr:hypothetical protein [Desulfovibrio sp.]
MAVEIRQAATSRELAEFVDLPFGLHSSHPLWVPPLKKQELELITPGRHPFWQTARRELFMAYRDSRPVGRIAAIIDAKYNAYAGQACGSFGFFECENDPEAASALLNAASGWLSGEGMTFMRGPLNPSMNYTCGALVAGFDLAPSLMMPWNPDWYPVLLETWGLRKEQDLFAYLIDSASLALPENIKAEAARLKQAARFTYRSPTRASMTEDIHAMLDIYQKAWAANWGFSPLSEAEAKAHVRELKSILDPEFFVLFFDGAKPVAGMVALPDMNPLLSRLGGSLGLSAPWHYWRSRKQIAAGMRIMLFGILPEYRLQGLPLLLLDYMLEHAGRKPGLKWVEGSWILEDNFAMNDLMEDFSGRLAKRYRIYRREIGQC